MEASAGAENLPSHSRSGVTRLKYSCFIFLIFVDLLELFGSRLSEFLFDGKLNFDFWIVGAGDEERVREG